MSLLVQLGVSLGISRVSLVGSAGCPSWVQQGVSLGFSRVSLLSSSVCSLFGSAGCLSLQCVFYFIQQGVSLACCEAESSICQGVCFSMW